MISIFNYLDYRRFLRDYYEARKALGGRSRRPRSKYTLERFAREAGLSCRINIFEIMSGKTRIVEQRIPDFIRAMGLSRREAEYFTALVRYNDAADTEEKFELFEKLRDLGRRRKIRIIAESELEYFSKWYIPVIREVAILYGRGANYRKMAKMIWPEIKPVEVRRAVKLLLKLGFLKKAQGGGYQAADPHVSSGDDVGGLKTYQFNKGVLEQAAMAMVRVPMPEREVSSMVLCVSREGAVQVKKAIQKFQDTISDIVGRDPKSDQVYLANFSLFPVTKLQQGKRKR
jgi:uncharacterized protein (TIGR02147 family)